MKVIVAGPRDFEDKDYVFRFLATTCFRITELVSGGATGVDKLGEMWAFSQLIIVQRFLPEWDKYGRGAGPVRNKKMAEYAEGLIVFTRNNSKGSLDMLWRAREHNLLIEHIDMEENIRWHLNRAPGQPMTDIEMAEWAIVQHDKWALARAERIQIRRNSIDEKYRNVDQTGLNRMLSWHGRHHDIKKVLGFEEDEPEN